MRANVTITVDDGVDWFLGKRFNGLRWLLLLLGASKERMNVIVPRAEKGLELKRDGTAPTSTTTIAEEYRGFKAIREYLRE